MQGCVTKSEARVQKYSDIIYISALGSEIIFVDDGNSPYAVLSEYGILVCLLCHIGVQIRNGTSPGLSHLQKYHSNMLKKYSSDLISVALSKAVPCDNQITPKDGNPIPEVAIKEGFSCKSCESYCCVNEAVMKRHAKDCQASKLEGEPVYSKCYLQKIFNQSMGCHVVNYAVGSNDQNWADYQNYLQKVTSSLGNYHQQLQVLPVNGVYFENALSKNLGLKSKLEQLGRDNIAFLFSRDARYYELLIAFLSKTFYPKVQATFNESSIDVRAMLGSHTSVTNPSKNMGHSFTLPVTQETVTLNVAFIAEWLQFLRIAKGILLIFYS